MGPKLTYKKKGDCGLLQLLLSLSIKFLSTFNLYKLSTIGNQIVDEWFETCYSSIPRVGLKSFEVWRLNSNGKSDVQSYYEASQGSIGVNFLGRGFGVLRL